MAENNLKFHPSAAAMHNRLLKTSEIPPRPVLYVEFRWRRMQFKQ